MKTILLLRHAKSDWGSPNLADFDRPLAKRGLDDAPRMGDVLINFDLTPDKILSSPAKRAQQTAELVAKACGYKKSIEWHDSFYGGDSEDLIGAICRLPETVERVMLVGHNPIMEITAATLLLGQEPDFDDYLAIKIPTAGLICLDAPVPEWSALEGGETILRWFLIPRLVKAME
ncbi:MAG: histidine phosphatase family protein [Anaerolineae bacterium]|nr:histidine phosphatase family protein [Anaerolineae bacterium]MCB0180911.1 histidine phosphatase family protein [Anaerolineae bacterium]MCB0222526.1 histidine phosphatase family protein [Anaerolineae bacterium]MCB9105251.1 histidine phosphatase family protein [Anaerolineales bacterium]